MNKILKTVFCTFALLVMLSAPCQAKGISLVSPKNGDTVNITNPTVRKWWNSYKKYSSAFNPKKKELTNPNPVVFKWKKEKGYSYKVYISTNSSFTNAQCHKTSGNTVKVKRLLRNQKYYWKVVGTKKKKVKTSSVRSFRTKNILRIIHVSNVSNFRDLGGGNTIYHHRIKQGMIYRSASLDDINDKGRKKLKDTLGIKTDLDLRQAGEGKAGKGSPAKLHYIHSHGISYERIWKNSKKKEVYNEMKVFTNAKNYPIVFHCTYGRDRTGTLAFLINGLLGAEKNDLYRDYECTYLTVRGSKDAKDRIKQFDALYNKMASYKDKKQSLSYNIEAYLLDIGMTKQDIQTIKNIMLEK